MKKSIFIRFSTGSHLNWLFILALVVILIPNISHAISFPWSTTFSYGPCTQRGANGQPDCATVSGLYSPDGIQWSWGAAPVGNNYTQTAAAANYPGGAGGLGMRSWIGDGLHNNSGAVQLTLPSAQKELWVRWYERWQQGAKWNPLQYKKTLYFRTAGPTNPYVMFYQDKYQIYNQSGGGGSYPSTSVGWNSVYPGGVSDGSWHCYEVHLKMDTGSANGTGQIWIDGALVSSMTNVNWSNNDAAAKNGFTWFDFQNNSDGFSAGNMYIDMDDMTVYNTTPPNRDAQGNPFIGPVGTVATKPPLAAPTGLKVM